MWELELLPEGMMHRHGQEYERARQAPFNSTAISKGPPTFAVVPIDLRLFSLAVCGLPEIELVSEDLRHGKQLQTAVRALQNFGVPKISVRC